MKYHDKSTAIQEAMDKMNDLIQNQLLIEENEEHNKSDNIPEGCVPVELENAMKDFKDIARKA